MARNNFINAESLIEQLTAAFKKHEKAIEESADALNKLDKQYSKLPSEYIKSQKDLISLNIQRSKSDKEVQNALRAKSMAEAAAIRTSETNRKAIDAQNKSLEKEQRLLTASENLYNKIQSKLNSLSSEYKNLAAIKELGLNLTAKEEQKYTSLQGRIQKYDSTLKAVDATMGKHQRNVGNYASGFNPLNHSIAQLARELPAAGNGFQTFVMAISNNAPIAYDALMNVVRANKELAAQGQPVTSAFKQVVSALFSFNTLMSVGITLAVIYGKEIAEWSKELFKSAKALDAVKDSQEELNTIRVSSLKSIVQERVELANNLKTAKDKKLTDEERLIAVKKIQEMYPFYFKNLTQEQILLGKTAEAEKEVNKALLARAKSQAAVTKITENQAKVIDLEEKRLKLTKDLSDAEIKASEAVKKTIGDRSRGDAAAFQAVQTLGNEEEIKRKILKTDKEIAYWNDVNNRLVAYSLTEREASIGLDYQEEKNGKKKVKNIQELNLELSDYLANLYALKRAQMELEASSLDKLWSDESKSFEQRLSAYNSFIEKKRDIAELDYNENLRLENKRYSEARLSAIKEVNDFIKDGGNKKEANEKLSRVLISLDKERAYNIEKIELDHSANVLDIVANMYKNIAEIKERAYSKTEQSKINQQELNDLREYNKNLLNISKSTSLNRIKVLEEQKRRATIEQNRKTVELDLQILNDKLSMETEGSEAYLNIRLQMIAKEKQLNDIEISENERKAAAQKKYLEDIKSYLRGFQDDFAGKLGFTTLFKALNGDIVGFGENLAVTMNASMEIMQEAMSFLNQQQEARYKASINRLMSEKEIAIKFAGESTTAREEIERQYEERRRQLERQKAKQAKDTAIFNIIIDTAQAVIGALAEQNYPGAVLFGLLGAAQLALVSSTPVPAYADGTENHSGGAMLINDGKGSNFKETVVTPDGKAKQYEGRNVLTSAPKGTKVFTYDQWQEKLNAMLTQQNIGFSASVLPKIEVNNNGLTKEDLNSGINKLASVIQNNESIQIIRDAKGERMFKKERGQRIEMLNSRLSIKSFSIKP